MYGCVSNIKAGLIENLCERYFSLRAVVKRKEISIFYLSISANHGKSYFMEYDHNKYVGLGKRLEDNGKSSSSIQENGGKSFK